MRELDWKGGRLEDSSSQHPQSSGTDGRTKRFSMNIETTRGKLRACLNNRTIKINALPFASEETEFSRKNSVSGAMDLPEMSFQTGSKI